jgi:hypothetical protein
VGLGVTLAATDALGVADGVAVARDAGPEHAVASRRVRKNCARSKVRIDGA